jgi:hypothetical protein
LPQYSNKLENQEEIDKFLGTYHPPKLNQQDIKYLYRCVMSNEVDTVIKHLPKEKSPGLNGFTVEFYKIFKEKLKPNSSNYLKKIQSEGMLPNSFYEASVTPIPKPDKDSIKKELQTNFLNEHKCKNSQ